MASLRASAETSWTVQATAIRVPSSHALLALHYLIATQTPARETILTIAYVPED